jgi:hypothetical protein
MKQPEDFPLKSFAEVDLTSVSVASNPTFGDVPAAFRAISPRGDPCSAQDGDLFPPLAYTRQQGGGLNEARNHFQGIQRLNGRHLVMSGGFATGRKRGSHILVVEMGSRPASGAWGSNTVFSGEPRNKDQATAVYRLHTSHWHAGGLSRMGDILAVPLEGGTGSRVAFLDVQDPGALGILGVPNRSGGLTPFVIERDEPKAGAVALATVPHDGGERYLCAVWREVTKHPMGRIEFYLSASTVLADGFLQPKTWTCPSVSPLADGRDPAYQTIAFLVQQNGGATRLFLVGLENGSGGEPFGNGPNFADLWEVTLPLPDLEDRSSPPPALTFLETREFSGLREYCNFDAASGCHIASNGALSLYSAAHWRVERSIRLSEFSARPQSTVSVADRKDGFVELYDAPGLRGRRLTIHGTHQSEIVDYRAIFVEAADFDEGVLSARYQIPVGSSYALFAQSGFQGAPHLLTGKGVLEEIPDLTAAGRPRVVRSSRYS